MCHDFGGKAESKGTILYGDVEVRLDLLSDRLWFHLDFKAALASGDANSGLFS